MSPEVAYVLGLLTGLAIGIPVWILVERIGIPFAVHRVFVWRRGRS